MENNRQGCRWTKASEHGKPTGNDRQRISIKYKGNPDVLIFINENWCWFDSMSGSDYFIVQEDSWSAIEWLSESLKCGCLTNKAFTRSFTKDISLMSFML